MLPGSGYGISLSLGGDLYSKIKGIQEQVGHLQRRFENLQATATSLKNIARGGIFNTRTLSTQAGHLERMASAMERLSRSSGMVRNVSPVAAAQVATNKMTASGYMANMAGWSGTMTSDVMSPIPVPGGDTKGPKGAVPRDGGPKGVSGRSGFGFRGPTPFGYVSHPAVAPLLGAYAAASAIGYGADYLAQQKHIALITQASAYDAAAIDRQARKIGSQTRLEVSEVLGQQLFSARAGKSTSGILASTEAAANLAIATGSTPDIAANTLVSASESLGVPAAGISMLADQLGFATLKSNQVLSQLGHSIERGSQLVHIGASKEELLATSMALANLGYKGSAGIRTIASGLVRMTSGQPLGNPKLGNYAVGTTKAQYWEHQTGQSIFNDAGKFQLRNFFQGLSNLKTMGKSEREIGEIIYRAFGIRASSKALPLSGQQDLLGEYDYTLKQLQGAQGFVGDIASKLMDTLHGDLKRFSAAMSLLSVTFTENISNPLGKFIQFSTNNLTEVVRIAAVGLTSLLSYRGIRGFLGPATRGKAGRGLLAGGLGYAGAQAMGWGAMESTISAIVVSAMVNVPWDKVIKKIPNIGGAIKGLDGKGFWSRASRWLAKMGGYLSKIPGWGKVVGLVAILIGAIAWLTGKSTKVAGGLAFGKAYRDRYKFGEPLMTVGESLAQTGLTVKGNKYGVSSFEYRTDKEVYDKIKDYRAGLNRQVRAKTDDRVERLIAQHALFSSEKWELKVGKNSSLHRVNKGRLLDLMFLLSGKHTVGDLNMQAWKHDIFGYANYPNLSVVEAVKEMGIAKNMSTDLLIDKIENPQKYPRYSSISKVIGTVTPHTYDTYLEQFGKVLEDERNPAYDGADTSLGLGGGLGEDGLSTHSRSATRGVLSKIHIEIHELVGMKNVDFTNEDGTTTEQIGKAAMTVSEAVSRQVAKTLLEGVARPGTGGASFRSGYD